jgi:nitrate reductase molybdenum cofactor assembly chaperone NarJ/NarW
VSMSNALYALFADLLEYPTPALAGQVKSCIESLVPVHPDAAGKLAEFQLHLQGQSLAQMEELYTSTFDMQPVCYPYVGFQLFGESYKRGAFMAKLVEGYRAGGYAAGKELPDHVAVILRFLAGGSQAQEGEFGRTLLVEGLLPGLRKMGAAMEGESLNPYAAVLSALLSVLETMPEREMPHA